ncbi:MAG: amino acid ABC transporter permease [Candidatus Accumulibacter sp.]|jgi:polar amino acid transport system permease protein|nr:amino acid ABC transporter permease [Accumulibacter sp.]
MASEDILTLKTSPSPRVLPRIPSIVLWIGAVALAWLVLAHFYRDTMSTLWAWAPLLAGGLRMNVLISVLAIAIGTVLGAIVGALELSRGRWIGAPAKAYVQVFRNAPILVLIFFATYVFPFEIRFGSTYLPFPDWIKATIGLALPASAHIAEIFRGAILSITSAQWEASASLGLSRSQTLRWVILPQCVKRVLPPWMNLYAMITMSTTLASLVGVTELLESAKNATNTVNRTDFTIIIYLAVLTLFFLYCYPITRFTARLERKYAFH